MRNYHFFRISSDSIANAVLDLDSYLEGRRREGMQVKPVQVYSENGEITPLDRDFLRNSMNEKVNTVQEINEIFQEKLDQCTYESVFLSKIHSAFNKKEMKPYQWIQLKIFSENFLEAISFEKENKTTDFDCWKHQYKQKNFIEEGLTNINVEQEETGSKKFIILTEVRS